MTSQARALTSKAIAKLAARKTLKVKQDLHEAEQDLQASNEALAQPGSKADHAEVLEHNIAAGEKVHAATEELEVVTELLHEVHDEVDATQAAAANAEGAGRTGEGSGSVIRHLRP